MKHLYIIFSLISISLMFSSCAGDEQNITEINVISSSENFDDFEEFDLRPYEINASLMVPKEDRTLINHKLDTYVWDLKKGKQTFITIHDWGTLDGFKELLKELENESEEVEFIAKEDNFTIYKLTTGTSKVTFHTAAQHDIDGINYLFESSRQGLSEDGVKDAVVSVKSVQKIND